MQILIFDRFLISIFVQDAIVQFIYLLCLLLDVVLDLPSRHAVRSTHSEWVSDKPVVHDSLSGCDELVCSVRANLQPNGVNKTSSAWSDHFLLKCTRKQLSFPDDHGRVVSISETIFAFPHFDRDFLRNDHAHDLLSSPQRFRLQNGRNGKFPREQLIIANTFTFLTVDPDD